MKTQLKNNSKRRWMLLSATMLMSSLFVVAQSSRQALDNSITQKIRRWEDSVRQTKFKSKPLYIGGTLSLDFPQYTLKSKIEALHGLKVSYTGTNVGCMISNEIGKLNANLGLYHSNSSVPYEFEMLQGAISGNLYLLRLRKVKYHTFEPYAKLGLIHQQTKFNGNYVSSENGSHSSTNYSTSDSPLLNTSQYNQMNLGAGVEYQLENNTNRFIHFFAEVNYGILISSRASNSAFNKTVMQNPTSVSFGINFGIIK